MRVDPDEIVQVFARASEQVPIEMDVFLRVRGALPRPVLQAFIDFCNVGVLFRHLRPVEAEVSGTYRPPGKGKWS
jgi:hypothetical protein